MRAKIGGATFATVTALMFYLELFYLGFGSIIVFFILVFGVGFILSVICHGRMNRRFDRLLKNDIRCLSDKLSLGLERFHLFALGRIPRLSNLKRGKIDDIHFAVFDHQHEISVGSGEGSHSVVMCHSVVWLQRKRGELPDFFIRPGQSASHWWDRDLWPADNHLTGCPTISSSYQLSGADESAIRELFSDDVLNFYEFHKERFTEGVGDKLIYYKARSNGRNVSQQSFLKEALQLLSLFHPTTQR
jgi:hypothetical protein